NENVYTDPIHKRSRRAVHATLRRSAGEADSGTTSRRLASNKTIRAAKANIVTTKNQSLLTIGLMIDIARLDEGSTPLSESSCRPEISNCAATRKRIAVVTLKNFCRLMRTLPLTNITPK